MHLNDLPEHAKRPRMTPFGMEVRRPDVAPPELTDDDWRRLEWMSAMSSQKRDAAQAATLAMLRLRARRRAEWEARRFFEPHRRELEASAEPDYAALDRELDGFRVLLDHGDRRFREQAPALVGALYDLQAFAQRTAAVLGQLDSYGARLSRVREAVLDVWRAECPQDSEAHASASVAKLCRPIVDRQIRLVPVTAKARAALAGLETAKEVANQIRDLMARERNFGEQP